MHHPAWNQASYQKHHRLADRLVDLMTTRGLDLHLPPGTVTRDCQRGQNHEQTTIDLIFSTLSYPWRCRVLEEIEQGSDHLPIQTIYLLEQPAQEEIKQPVQYNWKELDQEAFLKSLEHHSQHLQSLQLTCKDNINAYVSSLTTAIHKATAETIPLRTASRFTKPFWNIGCTLAVHKTKHLRRVYTRTHTEQAWRDFCQQRNLKGKILQKSKQSYYRNKVQNLTRDTAWSALKWSKAYQKGPRLNSLPTLPKGQYRATTLAEKTRLLQEEAFPAPGEGFLTDIQDYTYREPIHTQDNLSLEEILKTGLRSKPQSAPGTDKIPNLLVHIILRNRINLLERLYQACWNLGYHPTAFRTAEVIFLQKPGKRTTQIQQITDQYRY